MFHLGKCQRTKCLSRNTGLSLKTEKDGFILSATLGLQRKRKIIAEIGNEKFRPQKGFNSNETGTTQSVRVVLPYCGKAPNDDAFV